MVGGGARNKFRLQDSQNKTSGITNVPQKRAKRRETNDIFIIMDFPPL